MNIHKTNRLGLHLVENRFSSLKKSVLDIAKGEKKEITTRAMVNDMDAKEVVKSNEGLWIRMDVWGFQKETKVLRVSKSVMENAKLINIDSIKENIDVSELDFTSIVILLDNDTSGLIRITRTGSDFDFLYLKDLSDNMRVYFGSYSFLTKEFMLCNETEDTLFIIKLLAYLYYGEITNRFIPAKSQLKLNSFSRIQNNSRLNISFVDTLWRQRISTEGFKVSGHFRLQPIGPLRKKRKLIWIEEFNKEGYNRKATIELQKKENDK